MKKIRIGLIGVGKHFEENIIPALKLNTNVLIEGAYSSQNEKVQLLAHNHNIKNTTSDWRGLVESKTIDCVFVSGPPSFHKEVVFFCVEKKMPFFVEKPPLNKLIDFAHLENKLVPLNFVGYNFRYASLYRDFVRHMQKQADIVSSHVAFVSNKPRVLFWDKETILESYLYAVGIHPIEMVCAQFGKHKKSNMAFSQITTNTFMLDLQLFFENGKHATLHLGNYSNKLDYHLEIINTEGVVGKMNNMSEVLIYHNDKFEFNQKENIAYAVSGTIGGYQNSGYQNEIDDFIKSLANGDKKTTSDIFNSKQVYSIIEEVLSKIKGRS